MSDYFIETTSKLRNLFYNLFYLILCSFEKTFCSSCKCTSFPPQFLRFLKPIFFGLGVEVFLFSSMFIVEQLGSQQFKKLGC